MQQAWQAGTRLAALIVAMVPSDAFPAAALVLLPQSNQLLLLPLLLPPPSPAPPSVAVAVAI